MSKPRRRVTVETSKSTPEDSEKRKPSVFERLGPGGAQRKYDERADKSKSSQGLYHDKCRNWLLTGECTFGAQCKFQHGPFISKKQGKHRVEDDQSDDVCLKSKRSSNRRGSDSPEARSESRSRHDKDTKIKSTIVVKKNTANSDDGSDNSDDWDADNLDYKKELELEKKRQEIQRALSQLEGEESPHNLTIEKKLSKPIRESVSFTLKKHRQLPAQAFSSDYSSDSSPDRGKNSSKKSPKKASPVKKKLDKLDKDKKKRKVKSPDVPIRGKQLKSPSPSSAPSKPRPARSPSPITSVPSRSRPLRSPSPDMGKKKEHKKKYDTEDDSPLKSKHKKAKKSDRKHDHSPDVDFPKSKKKNYSDKGYLDRPIKMEKKDLSSDPVKKSRKSWSPMSRSRSRSRQRSLTPSPTKKVKTMSPVKPKGKVEKLKLKKKKGKNKLGGSVSAKERRVSPVRIKKKKIKSVLPYPIKRDIEEDLPARHSDSPGSENMPHRVATPESPRRKEPEREFFKGMTKLKEEDKDFGVRKNKRKRSESPRPVQRDRLPAVRGDIGDKRKSGQSLDRKHPRKDSYGSQEHGKRDDRRLSPEQRRSEDRSPTPVPQPSRRNQSPEGSVRSRSRRGRDEDLEHSRTHDHRSPADARAGKDVREGRGQPVREPYRERFARGEEHRPEPRERERFEQRFEDFPPPPEQFPPEDRGRFPEEREPFDPRDRLQQEVMFERGGRSSRRDRYERFPPEEERVMRGRGREFFAEPQGRGRGRQLRGPVVFEEYAELERIDRRPEWDDARCAEAFPREWPERHEMRPDDRFDPRRDDPRFEERAAAFHREDEQQLGRDARRGNNARSLERGWKERQDMDRLRVRERIDDRRRGRRSQSPPPFDPRAYREEIYPLDDRVFGRGDNRMMPSDRQRDERVVGPGERDDRGVRGERVETESERGGRMERRDDRNREDRNLKERGRDGSMEDRARGKWGREDRARDVAMDRGRDERVPPERMIHDEHGSIERDRNFQEEPKGWERDRNYRDERRGERGVRDEKGFRNEEENRGRDERPGRGERGKDGREDRYRERGQEDKGNRVPRGEVSPRHDRSSPDRKLYDKKTIKIEKDTLPSEDGKGDRSKGTSSKSESNKDRSQRDDKGSERCGRDGRSVKEERARRDVGGSEVKIKEERLSEEKVSEDKGKEDKGREERGKDKGRDDRGKNEDRKKKGERSPRRDGRREREKRKWPPSDDKESDRESSKGDESRTKDRKREKTDIPLSPIPKRLREVSPASSSRSRSSHSSRLRGRDPTPGSRRCRDGETEKDGRNSRRASAEKELKEKNKKLSSTKSTKARSLSPRPIKEEKVKESVKRKRSTSSSSTKSKEVVDEIKIKVEVVDKTGTTSAAVDVKVEDVNQAVTSPGGKSSHEEDKASDGQSLKSVPFSDWSEDDMMADNILNQAEAEAGKEIRRQRSASRSSRGSRTSVDKRSQVLQEPVTQESSHKAAAPTDVVESHENEDNGVPADDELDMPEYEQISSDEEGFMEDDSEKPSSIINILDIDWASLNETHKPKVKRSALRKYTPASIFAQIGVSKLYAGEKLFERVKVECQKQFDEETERDNSEKPDDATKEIAKKFVLLDAVTTFHCSALRRLKERQGLLQNIGPHRRALCARKDLEIRRSLCRVDKIFDQTAVYPSHMMDTDLTKLSIQLFRQGRGHSPEFDSEPIKVAVT